MLELRDLHKNFGDIGALSGCTFSVGRGELLGFLGPNGAGKTTAMRAIFGLIEPDAGEVTWNGSAIDSDTRLSFGYMPEERGLYPRMKVGEQVAYFASLHGLSTKEARSAAEQWLGHFGLDDRFGSRLEELSHGNQQRVQLATAMAHSPDLLVLDEPFAGLDPIGVESMAAVLAERAAAGATVVFSSHQLDLVEDICERVVIIDHGAVVLEGSVPSLRADSPHRYIDATVDTTARWWEPLPEATLVSESDGHVRVSVSRDVDGGVAFALASEAGSVRRFSFEPPALSELFLEAVVRP